MSHRTSRLFTSESVAAGHPDKIADQISDAVLDAILEQDPYGRVACETLVSTGLVVVAGEITTNAQVDITSIARDTIRRIGYTDPSLGFDADGCAVLVAVGKQSVDISQGVTEGEGLHTVQGAGDQGMMMGYACDETPELMPLPIVLSHRLVAGLARLRESGELSYLRPDGKSQVTVEYVDGKPIRVHTIVVSAQHDPDVQYEKIQQDLLTHLIKKVVPAEFMDSDTIIHINPTGRFVIGGPHGDTGLTGRKIMVDTYGGMARHGGGAFSGKDPSKVDRSATYAARYVAKNIVAAGLAQRCEVQLAYAIGVAQPVSIYVETFGTGKVSEEKIADLVHKHFDLTPKGIIETLDLRKPVYVNTARYGHFGRTDQLFSWEVTDKAAILKKDAEKTQANTCLLV